MTTSNESPRIKTTALINRLGIARSTLWRWLQLDMYDFPKPHHFGRDCSWSVKEIEAWEQSRHSSNRDGVQS